MQDKPASQVDLNRRNGRAASCEPCRKAKVRCDHTLPTCARCRRRGLSSQCFYHPAPLTKTHATSGVATPPLPTSSPDALLMGTSQSVSALPLGPIGDLRHSSDSTDETTAAKAYNERLLIAGRSFEKLVAHLDKLPIIDDVLQRYYALSPNTLIAGVIVLPALADLHKQWSEAKDKRVLLQQITKRWLSSAEATVRYDSRTTPSEFSQLHYGEHMRIEMFGFICTIAARASLHNLVQTAEERKTFVQDMYYCSDKCLSLALKLAIPVTDVLVWLYYENMILTSILQGDASYKCWRRLNELAAEMMVLGLHRDSSYAELPFFLAETRRRTFSHTYCLDKLIASLVSCPPRLSKRFTDCQMPLDLPEDQIFSENPPSADQLRQVVTKDGWNIKATHTGPAWSKVRYIMATFREELFEYDFRSPGPEDEKNLRVLLKRVHDTWLTIPSHLQYTSDCWKSGTSPRTCLMLAVSYLSYLQLDFQILQYLEKSDDSATSSLLEVSLLIVTTIRHIGAARGRVSYMNHDFEYLSIAYGVPSAIRLAHALADKTPSGMSSLPSSVSRSSLVRSLSVFVSGLESLHEVGQVNQPLINRSVETISKILDDVLGNTSNSNSAVISTLPSVNGMGMMELVGLTPGLPALNLPGYSSSDLSQRIDICYQSEFAWMHDFDWTSPDGDWIRFDASKA